MKRGIKLETIKKILIILFKPVIIAGQEIKKNRNTLKKLTEKKHQRKMVSYIYINVLVIILYSTFFLASIYYIIIGIFVHRAGFVFLITSIPALYLTSLIQKKLYFNNKKRYFERHLSHLKEES